MRSFRSMFTVTFAAVAALASFAAYAANLPNFDDFRRVDRMRRLTGQLQSAELLEVSQINAQAVVEVALKNAGDWELQWGAAETLVEWPNKQRLYEAALAASRTNQAVALRFACAAARYRQDDLAFRWLRHCEKKDTDNIVPWLVEIWLRNKRANTPDLPVEAVLPEKPPEWATVFRDEAAGAAQARVRMLEAAGYSPYSARRLGFMPELYATVMARELAEVRLGESAKPLLLGVARAMQVSPIFYLTELVGQTLEQAVLSTGGDESRPEARFRTVELEMRRQEIKDLIAKAERNAVEFATEQEMTRYFDDLLTLGEQEAMLRLLRRVGKGKNAP